jgi:formimidoylglutamate deiminase
MVSVGSRVKETLLPDLVLDAKGSHAGIGVTVEDGAVVGIGPASVGERLAGRALMRGFVNDHSHAFQRGLRGKVERVDPEHPRDDFWTWRERMYALAEGLDPASMREAGRRCYAEMLSAGYTGVTEFHYVHHRPDGAPHGDPNAMAKALVAAAEDAGIRLLLLPVAYVRGGVPRFRDADLDAFLSRVEALRGYTAARPLVEIGLAAHSVRAVPRGWLEGLAGYAHVNGLALHVHSDEQPGEVEGCVEEHGMRPIELLAESGFLGPRTTVVHATHANGRELDLIAEHGASVCACPTTEGNLGDGFLPAEEMMERGIPLSVGSDSHVRIDPFEELREMETNARRLAGRRNVLVPPGGTSPAPWLLRAGWGRDALGPGAPADLVEIDLTHPAVADVEQWALPAALVFGAGSAVVAGAWVAGRRVYRRRDNG